MFKAINKIKKNQKGAAALEMALVFPIFLLFVLGIIEFTRAYWILHTMQLGIDEAGRYAMLHTSASDSVIVSTAKANMYGLDGSQFTVTSASQNINGLSYKVITATYPFNFIVPNLLPFNSITFSRTTSVPLMP